MAEWTDGERRVIDALKRIQAVIDTEEFKDLSRAFTAEHKDTFEVCDENKLIYTDLHEAYVELMERELLSRVVGVDLDELVQNLPDFVARQRFEQDPEGTGRTIEFLLSLTDFAAFKGLMLSAKLGKDDAGTAAPLALHSAEALAAVGKLNAPADLVSHFAELLALAEGSGAEAWRTIAERKSVYTLQATTRAGVRYQRIAMAISLTVPQLIDAMCDIAHPEHARWSEMIDSVEVLRDQRDGRQIDSLARAHVRLPGARRARRDARLACDLLAHALPALSYPSCSAAARISDTECAHTPAGPQPSSAR